MGAALLRSEALSDPVVIDLVNAEFVPVWIDIRRSALPDLPFWPQVLEEAKLTPDRHVADLYSKSFFLREVVTSPDGQVLLNPQSKTAWGSIGTLYSRGHFAYAQTIPHQVKSMLAEAWKRFEAHQARACAK